MSAMAGALNVQLEKPGFYILGDDKEVLSPVHIMKALRIMELTAALFGILIVFPLLILNALTLSY
jgi:cobalamin biosynthesis protein CobD/CbiB